MNFNSLLAFFSSITRHFIKAGLQYKNLKTLTEFIRKIHFQHISAPLASQLFVILDRGSDATADLNCIQCIIFQNGQSTHRFHSLHNRSICLWINQPNGSFITILPLCLCLPVCLSLPFSVFQKVEESFIPFPCLACSRRHIRILILPASESVIDASRIIIEKLVRIDMQNDTKPLKRRGREGKKRERKGKKKQTRANNVWDPNNGSRSIDFLTETSLCRSNDSELSSLKGELISIRRCTRYDFNSSASDRALDMIDNIKMRFVAEQSGRIGQWTWNSFFNLREMVIRVTGVNCI